MRSKKGERLIPVDEGRSIYFDILRCVSMFAVVGVHVYGSLLPGISGGINSILSSIVENFNSLGVFFFRYKWLFCTEK